MMKIAILGYGGQGKSAYDYWRDGNDLTVCDTNEHLDLPNDVQRQLGSDYLRDLDRFDLLIRTPALHPKDIVEANGPDILEKVWSNTNEFIKACPSRHIIGVTGTKGKGTASTLIVNMLEAAGKRVHLGGNIGVPPLDMLKNDIKSEDWVVLELANFQLIDLKQSPSIGVCLMVEAEHLDWHTDVEEYITAKQQLFHWQTSEDIAVYYAANENSKRIASVSQGRKVPYFESPGATITNDSVHIDGNDICKTNELKLLGKHNWQNVCAAVTAVWQATQDVAAIRSVLTTFTGLEHRLELVRELDGVKYYDDSFGTTPETAIVAIEAFEEPKVVILGGSTKGSHYDTLAQTVAANTIRRIILIGNTGNPQHETATTDIEAALRARGIDSITSLVKPGGSTMAEIVAAARDAAQPGDVVLLSTACASFDMFRDYKNRGEQFKEAVLALFSAAR